MTNIPKVDDVINSLEDALSSYEQTVSVAASAGLDIATKEINYEWTYVQSVFFTSTIITTVGKWPLWCIFFSSSLFCYLQASLSISTRVGSNFKNLEFATPSEIPAVEVPREI